MTSTLERTERTETPERTDRPRPKPAGRRNRRTLRLLVVDTLLFFGFLLAINVPLTGLAVHEWLGIAVGAGLVAHLVQHGDWVRNTGRRLVAKTSLQNRLNYLLMVALFAGFGTIVISGLLISEVALPFLGVVPAGSTFWLWLHLASVGWVIWLTAMHIAMNWRWIVKAVDRFVVQPLARSASR